MAAYLVNGMVVETDVPLAHGRRAAGGAQPDLRIRFAGCRRIPPEPVEGRVLQGLRTPEALRCTTVRTTSGEVVVRLHGTAEFRISPSLRDVEATRDPTCSIEMLGIFVLGHLQATVLALRGETVLHASAVETGGAAVAFVADSGMGKSTLAALACGRGARFVTDDVLRWTVDADDAVRAWPGATHNRLRRGVEELAGPGVVAARSADGRAVWAPPATTADEVVVAAVVLPVCDRSRARLELVRLNPSRALLELGRRPRILGWADPAVIARSFHDLAELVRRVPVYTARVPWGPPFDSTVVDGLLALCGNGSLVEVGRGL